MSRCPVRLACEDCFVFDERSLGIAALHGDRGEAEVTFERQWVRQKSRAVGGGRPLEIPVVQADEAERMPGGAVSGPALHGFFEPRARPANLAPRAARIPPSRGPRGSAFATSAARSYISSAFSYSCLNS